MNNHRLIIPTIHFHDQDSLYEVSENSSLLTNSHVIMHPILSKRKSRKHKIETIKLYCNQSTYSA